MNVNPLQQLSQFAALVSQLYAELAAAQAEIERLRSEAE